MMVVGKDGFLVNIRRQLSPDIGGALEPEAIVLHYTGAGSAEGSIDWLSRKDEIFVSAHLVISRVGSVTQLIPFNRVAWHAGVSQWQGRPALNKWSIGIELANHGPLQSAASGYAKTQRGDLLLPREVYSGYHKNGKTAQNLWEAYLHAQVLRCLQVCQAIIRAYPAVKLVLGHDDVAPERKTDPGPAFPMEDFRACLLS